MNRATDRHELRSAEAVPESHVDFTRPLVSILGLPFDAIDVAQAVQRVRADAFAGRRCFMSTPNLNFAIAARTDEAFRGSVLRSDLSLVDGMPLVWIARLLRLPVRERVAGSDVFEALLQHPGPPISVYLFGAPEGAAARAGERINQRSGGVRCVGHDSPGFGSVESMSSDECIARINDSGAQFVVVALGAKKGQAWIEHNASRLKAPVLAHLGAVVNFAAGSVARAPRWMQRAGLEWIWRIKEEPGLWRRYWSDGLEVARLLLTRVLPDAMKPCAGGAQGEVPPRFESRQAPGLTALELHGAWCETSLTEFRGALTRCAARGDRLEICLSGVSNVGCPVIATLLQARGWFGSRAGFTITGISPAVEAMFRRKLVDDALLGAR
jgi:N-acetylglucosaminyldiphosphoundecaprenol N-acetyl-beta-D-mannosaminyltransferase